MLTAYSTHIVTDYSNIDETYIRRALRYSGFSTAGKSKIQLIVLLRQYQLQIHQHQNTMSLLLVPFAALHVGINSVCDYTDLTLPLSVTVFPVYGINFAWLVMIIGVYQTALAQHKHAETSARILVHANHFRCIALEEQKQAQSAEQEKREVEATAREPALNRRVERLCVGAKRPLVQNYR